MDEWQLLRQYVEENSQAAFASLVERYINLVYSTCLREVRDPALAEDVTQVVFLLLARKAKTMRRGVPLSAWLYQTARFAARDALKQEARRHRYEQQAAGEMMREMIHQMAPDKEVGWQELEPLLHEALDSLGAHERQVVLLRFFEGRSLREAGAALGISEDAARKRVERALEKLRRYFAKRGYLISGVVLAGLLAENAVQAAPIPFVAATLKMASVATLHSAAAHSAAAEVVGAKVLSLCQGTLRAMLIHKSLASVGVYVGLGLIGSGIVGSGIVGSGIVGAGVHLSGFAPGRLVAGRSVAGGFGTGQVVPAPPPAPPPVTPLPRAQRPRGSDRGATSSTVVVATKSVPDAGATQHASGRQAVRRAPGFESLFSRSPDHAPHRETAVAVEVPAIRGAPAIATIDPGIYRRSTTLSEGIMTVNAILQHPQYQSRFGRSFRTSAFRTSALAALWLASSGRGTLPVQAQPELPPRFVVTTTNDSGPGSLRESIQAANQKPGSTVVFNIARDDPNFQNGVFTIKVKNHFPKVTGEGIIIDGASQLQATGDTNRGGPVIQLVNEIEIPAGRTTTTTGISIAGANCVVNGLIINKFSSGVILGGTKASGCQVRSCYIGTDPLASTVSAATGNGDGIRIQDGASHNRIGGQTPAERNIIAGNKVDIAVYTGAGENVIEGNYLGTDRSGDHVLSRGRNIFFNRDAGLNLVGGLKPEARNILNTTGDYALYVAGEKPQGNIIQGNFIGTDKTGTTALARGAEGVFVINPQPQTLIGGAVPGAGNVIAPYTNASIYCSFTSGIIIQGNTLGLDAAGKRALGDGGSGVLLYESSNVQIGGAATGTRNIIGGNLETGIKMLSEAARPERPQGNVVQGNTFGLDAEGRNTIGQLQNGIVISGGARDHLIGLDVDGQGLGNIFAFGERPPGLGNPIAISIAGKKEDISGNLIRGNTTYFTGKGLGHDVDGHGVPNVAVLTEATAAGGKLSLTGTLNALPDTEYIVDFYASPADDKVRGDVYLGSTPTKTSPTGNATYTVRLPVGATYQAVRAAVSLQGVGTGNLGAALAVAKG